MAKLTTYMTGSFNSQEQSEADTIFFNIYLNMKPIWTDREDAVWLYVEQAAAWALDKPYRQRVYRLKQLEDGRFESAVFTFMNPLRFAGDWKKDSPLSTLTPDSLTERSGCALILSYENETFAGSTNEKDCFSELRGASYATSEVEIKPDVLTSWDRGYDAEDNQV